MCVWVTERECEREGVGGGRENTREMERGRDCVFVRISISAHLFSEARTQLLAFALRRFCEARLQLDVFTLCRICERSLRVCVQVSMCVSVCVYACEFTRTYMHTCLARRARSSSHSLCADSVRSECFSSYSRCVDSASTACVLTCACKLVCVCMFVYVHTYICTYI